MGGPREDGLNNSEVKRGVLKAYTKKLGKEERTKIGVIRGRKKGRGKHQKEK